MARDLENARSGHGLSSVYLRILEEGGRVGGADPDRILGLAFLARPLAATEETEGDPGQKLLAEKRIGHRYRLYPRDLTPIFP
jgi:hypothetical protein